MEYNNNHQSASSDIRYTKENHSQKITKSSCFIIEHNEKQTTKVWKHVSYNFFRKVKLIYQSFVLEIIKPEILKKTHIKFSKLNLRLFCCKVASNPIWWCQVTVNTPILSVVKILEKVVNKEQKIRFWRHINFSRHP